MNEFDFDKQFKRTTNMIYVAWLVGAVVSLSALGGIVWVAWHFLSKVW